MTRKKRTPKEYEQEIISAAKRIKKKYKESRMASKNNPEWIEFLENLGIDTQTGARQDFWEKVRVELAPLPSRIPINFKRANVKKTKQGSYRNKTTGRFVSKAYVRNVSYFSERRLAEARVSIDRHGRFRDNETGKYISTKTIEER